MDWYRLSHEPKFIVSFYVIPGFLTLLRSLRLATKMGNGMLPTSSSECVPGWQAPADLQS